MRKVPCSYLERVKEPKVEDKKRRSNKEVAIERAKSREDILLKFCKKFNIDRQDELCKNISKIFKSPKTKNISLADYKQQLELIGQAIPILGIDRLTLIVAGNAIKGYMRLIYDNQLNLNKKSSKIKDNICDLKSNMNKSNMKLSNFDSYRGYLNEPSNDDELKIFVKETFHIDLE